MNNFHKSMTAQHKADGFLPALPLTLYNSTCATMRSSCIIHYGLPVKPSVPLRECHIQSLEGDTENQAPARNPICASRRKS